MFSKEQVMHVANLAKLELSLEEVSKYQKELDNILKEIDKIDSIDIDMSKEILFINPSTNKNVYRTDKVGDMLSTEESLKNAPKSNENYIEVPGVLNE